MIIAICVEIRHGSGLPDPNQYDINESQTKTTRYEHRSFGLDNRSNQKTIKLTPGPGEYVHTDCLRSTTKNFGLKHHWQNNDLCNESTLR